MIAFRDISQPLRDKTEGGAKTAAARIRDIPRPCGLKPVLLPFGGREMSVGEEGEVGLSQGELIGGIVSRQKV